MRENEKLCFNPDGHFKIAQIADTQEIPDVSPDTIKLIEAVLDREKPDLVVFTGDQVKGYSTYFRGKPEKVRSCIAQLIQPLEARKIPFAVTFGNHDDQCGLNNLEQLEIYKESPMCVSDTVPGLTGGGTDFLPVYDCKGDKTVFGIYLIDSQGNQGDGYAPVAQDEIEWYRQKRDELEKENGGKVLPSILFQHIPLKEYYNVLVRKTKKEKGFIRAFREHKGFFFGLDEKLRNSDVEFMGEVPASPYEQSGQFDAIHEKGDVFAVYAGHDHNNCFVRNYKGIDFGYTPGCGFNVYGPGLNRGIRLLEFNEQDPRAYKTHVDTFKELCGTKLQKPLLNFLYCHAPTNIPTALFWARNAVLTLLGAGVAITAIVLLIQYLMK